MSTAISMQQFRQLQREVYDLKRKVETIADDDLEVKPSILKRWYKISKQMDKGAGIKFRSLSAFQEYMKSL